MGVFLCEIRVGLHVNTGMLDKEDIFEIPFFIEEDSSHFFIFYQNHKKSNTFILFLERENKKSNRGKYIKIQQVSLK